ncbi:hypothetical protein D5H75_38470 [Bailinhaonella thermotolerans]|uniref:Uncharacterized protein n=1 Tax=Bailinhaonella thermotolerans TaxID=1070861 RepID=A0A3A4AJR1_9ACTN|nr:hypothetical protein D5H75_38470 [Bailinhaonella thermotolerans]
MRLVFVPDRTLSPAEHEDLSKFGFTPTGDGRTWQLVGHIAWHADETQSVALFSQLLRQVFPQAECVEATATPIR